jgi:hypothetical protein
MKKTFYALCLLASALCALSAPEEFVTKTASGTTSATVYFEPGPQSAALTVADVTSDKAASVLSWRTGTNQLTILKAVPATAVSNIFTTVGYGFNINSNLLSVTAAGVMTTHLAGTNKLYTNSLVTLENPIGTNLAVGDPVRERMSTYFAVSSTASSNEMVLATPGTFAPGDKILMVGRPDQLEAQNVFTYATNSGAYTLIVTNGYAFTPQFVYTLTTNLYTNVFAVTATASSLIVSNRAGGLAAADHLLFLPATGGAFVKQISTVSAYSYMEQWIGAATGVALAVDDRLFMLSTAVNTPVGAATLRLMADTVRVLPANLPGVLSIDGTSACAVNAAVVRYK